MPKETVQAHLGRHDREIAAIRKLVMTGMKMLVRLERNMDRLEKAQPKTEQSLDRFIRSLERGGGNGHVKGRKIQ